MIEPNAAMSGIKAGAPIIASMMQGLVNFAKKGKDSLTDKIVAEFQIGFSEILERSFERCQKVRTLTSGDNPSLLSDIYVNLKLSNDNSTYEDADIVENLENYKRIVLTGLAGAGKSMFMKYLTVGRFENNKGKFPLFIELRYLNSISSNDILNYCFYSTASANNKLSFQNFVKLAKAGLFIFIFDGFDELEPHIKDDIEGQILQLSREYPKALIVVSSRPDNRFNSWTNFSVFHVCKMTLQDSIKVIEKINHDTGIKKRFKKEMPVLWQTHSSFLSIPLLATIMLLTFGKFSEISPKFSLFYKLAFQTLFREHDASKEQFKRTIQSGLDMSDFERLFSAFCAISYTEHRLAFEEKEAIKIIDQAKIYCRIDCDSKLVMDDLINCLCVLQPDGLEFTFVHRSFQEYFSALFIIGYHENNIFDLINDAAKRDSDNTLLMAYEIDAVKIEKFWLKESIENLYSEMNERNNNENSDPVFTMFYTVILFDQDVVPNGLMFNDSMNASIIKNAAKICMDEKFSLDVGSVFSILMNFFRSNAVGDFTGLKERILASQSEQRKSAGHDYAYEVTAADRPWLDECGISELFQPAFKTVRSIRRKVRASPDESRIIRLP